MSPTASYDEIADWYEHEFLAQSGGLPEHPLGIDRALIASPVVSHDVHGDTFPGLRRTGASTI